MPSIVVAQSSDVQIAVDQVDHLVGNFCPGTVSITCKGTYLTNLRWTYNGNNRIYIFESDNEERVYSIGQPAFISVELKQIENYHDVRFANFTSVLFADLAQLDDLNVRNISCGNPIASITLPVSVSVQPSNALALPNITNITAVYNFTQLESMQISWQKHSVSLSSNSLMVLNCVNMQVLLCNFSYIAKVTTGISVLSQLIEQEICDTSACTIQFDNLQDRLNIMSHDEISINVTIDPCTNSKSILNTNTISKLL